MPSPIDRFNKLLDKHTLDRLKEEDSSARRLYLLLEAHRKEMLARLLAFEEDWKTSNRFTPTFLVSAISDVTATMGKLAEKAGANLRADMLKGFDAGQEQTFREIAVYEKDLGIFKPATPTNTILTLIEARTDNLKNLFGAVRSRIAASLAKEANSNLSDAQALERAGEAAEKVKDALARGILSGKGTESIAKRLMGEAGEFPKMAYGEAIRTVRHAINESYNEGHDETIREGATRTKGLGRGWLSALVRSTKVCLDLHGQTCGVSESFKTQGVEIARPPAIHKDLKPSWHLCRSRVIPHKESWPKNPKLEPLTEEEKKHFSSGGGFRAKDIAQPKPYGFKPALDGAKEELEERAKQTEAAVKRANELEARKADERKRANARRAKAKRQAEKAAREALRNSGSIN